MTNNIQDSRASRTLYPLAAEPTKNALLEGSEVMKSRELRRQKASEEIYIFSAVPLDHDSITHQVVNFLANAPIHCFEKFHASSALFRTYLRLDAGAIPLPELLFGSQPAADNLNVD
jgi:hypothetical protein